MSKREKRAIGMNPCYKLMATILKGMIIAVISVASANAGDSHIKDYATIDRLPNIDPNYVDIVIPPNIAPLNLTVHEEGTEYRVDIYGGNNGSNRIALKSKKNKVIIPIKKWKKLLSSNLGNEFFMDIYVKDSAGKWKKFRTITNRIAQEKIDSHVAYRLINPAYVLWWEMGIYQRNIENYDESAILTNRVTKKNCMNCHAFCKNNPDMMMFHMRAEYGGTMVIKNGQINKIDTGTKYTMSAGVYPAWHPDGNHIAFSVNKIYQTFHAQKDQSTLVWDRASDLIIYDVRTNSVTTSPKVSTRRAENTPAWSPDGKYLYFISGPQWTDSTEYDRDRYNLMRISYDVETNQWGEVETVIDAADISKSVTFPRISPDGKYLLFTMCDYGYFTIYSACSDLYMLDMKTNRYRRLDVNSEFTESYHSWSSNSRWFVFVSKRRDGLCSRLYFSYVDTLGNVHKPFLLPQKDPAFYDTFVMNYNLPEMIDGPVKVSPWNLMQAAHKEPVKADFDQTVDIDALSGATKIIK
jgi:hypothetical protein